MSTRRHFTDEEIAHALAVLRSNGGNAKRTALQLGISRTTLRQWAGRAQSSTAHPRLVEVAAVDDAALPLAHEWRKVADKLVAEVLGREDLSKASVRDLLVGAGIATDKEQLLIGSPTSRVESVRISLVSPTILRDRGLSVIEGKRSA